MVSEPVWPTLTQHFILTSAFTEKTARQAKSKLQHGNISCSAHRRAEKRCEPTSSCEEEMVPLRYQRTLCPCSLLPFLRFALKMTSCFLLGLYVASFAFLISQIRLKHMKWEVKKRGKQSDFILLFGGLRCSMWTTRTPESAPDGSFWRGLVSTRTRTASFAATSFSILTGACPSEEAVFRPAERWPPS